MAIWPAGDVELQSSDKIGGVFGLVIVYGESMEARLVCSREDPRPDAARQNKGN